MRAIGESPSAAGVVNSYRGLLDGIVVDAADPEPPPGGIATAVIDTLMDGAERRTEVARDVLDFCAELR